MEVSEKTFAVSIITPTRIVFQGRVVSLVAPGAAGHFGVLALHEPFVFELARGKLTMRQESGGQISLLLAAPGLLRVRNNDALLLLDGDVEEVTY
jgi:F-type H+-transporting ATPase subunit epsilon